MFDRERMWCFKGEELDLLQRHEITTAEKSFMCHSNFTQGSHVVEVNIINNTAPDACYIIHSSMFNFSFNSHPTPFNLNEF